MSKKVNLTKLSMPELIKILDAQKNISERMEVLNEVMDQLTEKGYTRADCAEDTGFSESTLSRWKSTERQPSGNNYFTLDQHLRKKVKEMG